jgi:hypothetical protein
MGRIYVVGAEAVTVASGAIRTLCWINPGTSRSLRVFRAHVSQSSTTTAGMVRVRLSRQVSAFPTLNTAVTPRAVDPSDAASAITGATTGAAGTAGVNASGEGAGGKTVIGEWAFLITAGFDLWLPEKEQIVLPASSTSGLSLHWAAEPSTLTGWNAQLWFEEV